MRSYVTLLFVLCAFPVMASGQTLTHVWIQAENAPQLAAQLEAEGFDVLEGSVTAVSLELIVSAEELEILIERGYFPITLAKSRPLREKLAALGDVPPGYPDWDEVLTAMSDAAAAYPSICQMVDLTTTHNVAPTHEGRHMYAVKISDNVTQDEDEPVFQVVSCHHAREIVTPVIALYAIEQLTTKYGTDPRVTAAVDGYEIWIAPVWNPDGYVYVFDVNNMWRKNRTPYPGGVGVDLNRNYPFGWYTACSGSTYPSSSTYKGPSPASEAETQTMIAWSHERLFTKVIDYHSSGREVLWGYDTCRTHPFGTFLRNEAIELSKATGYGGSVRGPSADGEHYQWQLGLKGTHGFLIETHTSFQPEYKSAQAEAVLVWPGMLWMIERAIPLRGHVTDKQTGAPVVASITHPGVNFPNGEENHSSARFGRYHAFLPAGSYTAEFSASGYVSQSIPVTVTATGEEVLEVELVRESLLGDMNCDGKINFDDIDPFVLALGGQAGYQAQYPNCNWYNADINGDGKVNFEDIDPFVALLAP